MLEDRDYMRQPEYDERRWHPNFRLRWSWTMVLLTAYLAVLVAELVTGRFFPQSNLFFGHTAPGYLALSKEGIESGYVWQLVTYQFMHAGWLHLFLNCWAIFVFGSELERLLGGRQFLALVFSSGIVGGMFQVLSAVLWPELFGGEVVGASACAFGLVAAFAMIFPERELTMLIFFVIPVRLRAKTLLIVSLVMALVGIVFSDSIFGGNLANAAHLGGMAMGWFYVRKVLNRDWMPHWFEKPARSAELPAERTPESSTTDFLADEVDPILDKISARGIQSLTAREREILEKARAKMAKH